ncbi:MAG: hypothetical protein ACXACI_12280 [Candidatus Hodarchaeales archaeon]
MRKKGPILSLVIFLVFSVQFIPLANSVQGFPFHGVDTKSLSSTSLNSPLIESLELLAGKDRAMLAQAAFLGGNVTVPFDLDSDEFAHLRALIFAAGQQKNWINYWVSPIWELGDGFTLLLVFENEGYTTAVSHAKTIAAQTSLWLGYPLEPLFGFQEGTTSTIAYYASPSKTVLDSYFSSWARWEGSSHSDGFMHLIKSKLETVPVRVAADVLFYDPASGNWTIWSAAALVMTEAITVLPDNSRNISLANIFNINSDVDQISGSTDSIYSHITLKLPYLANVASIDPPTDNLFPEITGRFNWTMRVNVPPYFVENQYQDIQIIYDLNISSLETFPQIEADYAIDKIELDSGTLNYSLTLTNVGNEEARNVAFAVPLGTPPQNFTIAAFNDTVYNFSNGRVIYWDYVNGEVTETDPGLAWNLTIIGWFTYAANDSIVQPVVTLNLTSGHYNLDMVSTIAMVHDNVTLFTFVHADDLVEVEDISHGEKAEPEFGLAGNFSSLVPNESRTVWYAIDNIPNNETVLALDFETIHEDIGDQEAVIELQGRTVLFRDWIINETKATGGDLRIPGHPEVLDFLPGLLFVYEDIAERNYFGWSNGLAVQLYDDEAILKTTISTDKVLTRVGENVTVNVTVENLGNSMAGNVTVTAYHAFLDENWGFQGVQDFYSENLGNIPAAESASITFTRRADTFLGIHPLFAIVNYTTDPGQTANETSFFNELQYHGITSNLINLFVLPPAAKEGKAEPSFPTPELNISSELVIAGESFEVNDTAEVHITTKNLGDEPTTIRIKSYFSTAHLSLNTDHYLNRVVRVVRNSQTELQEGTDYNVSYSTDGQLGIWQIEITGINVPPNDTIEVYYALRADTEGNLVLPPVEVEYDSSFPIEGVSGAQTSSQEERGALVAQNQRLAHCFQVGLLGISEDSGDQTTHAWSSYSDPLPIEIKLPAIPTLPSSEVPEEVKEAYNLFLGNVSLLGGIMLIFVVYLVILNWKSKRS